MTVHFNTQAELKEFIDTGIAGAGGGQTFVRDMQTFFRFMSTQRPRLSFDLNISQTERWLRYACDYGDGGFQRRLGRAWLISHPTGRVKASR